MGPTEGREGGEGATHITKHKRYHYFTPLLKIVDGLGLRLGRRLIGGRRLRSQL